MANHIVIPIFIPHKGCPFDCIYCNQKTISGVVEDVTEEKMRNIIEQHISSANSDAFIEIGFYGGSFTGIPREQQISYLKTANEYINSSVVQQVRLSTRPDYINEEILDCLAYYNVKIIELGVQSFDSEVLLKSNRGHNEEDVFKSSRLIKEYGIGLGIQTMIGLPGDSREKDVYTAERVIEIMPQIVRIYPTLVVRGTYLEKIFNLDEYSPLSLEDAVDTCSELLEMYESNNIKVIRIGLQPTDNISEEGDVVAGPFHPAFRQLVESKLTLNRLVSYINENRLVDVNNIIIYTTPKNISNVIGHKKQNISYLKSKFGFHNIRVECSEMANLKVIAE